MLDRRLWPSLLYILLFLLVCITIREIRIPGSLGPPSEDLSDDPKAYTLFTSNATATYTHPVHSLPSNDYNRLINLNFSFEMLNLVCNDSAPPFLLVLVHSSTKNFQKRQSIRQTWGKNTDKVRVAFMLGTATEPEVQQKLDIENENYQDMIQGTFEDTYRNITYKHIMVFKYAIYHCPHAKYILKLDDDVFVNMPTMLQFLQVDLSPHGGTRMLFCTVRHDVVAKRSFRSKWRVSFKEYPNRIYPDYCPGWALLYSPDVVFDLYREAQISQDFFWIDDIYVTGILTERIHLRLTDVQKLVLSEENHAKILANFTYDVSQPFLYASAATGVWPSDMKVFWNYVTSHYVPKSLLKEIQQHDKYRVIDLSDVS